jgi:hypothetical protein
VSGRYLRFATARSTHAAHRAVFHRLGLSVGIAIALAGCSGRTVQQRSFDSCMFYVTNRGNEATAEEVRACADYASSTALSRKGDAQSEQPSALRRGM